MILRTRLLRSFPSLLALVVLVACAALVAGCSSGDGDGDDDGDGGGSGGKASLTHADGTLVVQGDRITISQESGGAALEFAIGPAIQRGTLSALSASAAKARVFYAPDGEKDEANQLAIAVAVQPAPTAGAGAQTYEGQVVKVSSTEIELDGDDGKRTFIIRAADEPAFDGPHLEEHRSEGEPVRVYYRVDGSTDYAVAYEDA